MNKVLLVAPYLLRPHEAVIPEKVMSLLFEVMKRSKWLRPIIVDRETFTIMDGHHRHRVATLLGLKSIPCYLVDYKKDVQVFSRRRNYVISADSIIEYSKAKKLYPYKTTKHVFCKHKTTKCNFLIKELQ